MDNHVIDRILTKLDNNTSLRNFIAQGNTKYLLENVKEPTKNWPVFTHDLDKRLKSSALSYIELGCKIAENGINDRVIKSFERGASILEYLHSARKNDDSDRD